MDGSAITGLEPDRWYHATVRIDCSNAVYSMELDGKPVLKQIPFSLYGGIDRIYFTTAEGVPSVIHAGKPIYRIGYRYEEELEMRDRNYLPFVCPAAEWLKLRRTF